MVVPTDRKRADQCPGVFRPWAAQDGQLVRLRLIGGRISRARLHALLDVAETFGDGDVHVTSRANLQVRGLPASDRGLPDEVVLALEATGLLPSRTHELARNIMVSPATGLSGGQLDLRTVAADLDRRLIGSAELSALPGRFLFVLDDGRGDLLDRRCDLGLVGLPGGRVQLRVGDHLGPVVMAQDAADQMIRLASQFVRERGTGPSAAWHVRELPRPLTQPVPADSGLPAPSVPLPFGRLAFGQHHAVGEAGLDRPMIRALTASAEEVIVTPWRGVLVPEREPVPEKNPAPEPEPIPEEDS